MNFTKAFLLMLAVGLVHPLLAAAVSVIVIVILYMWPEKVL